MEGQKIPISIEVDGKQLAKFDQVLMNRWKRANNLRVPLQQVAKYMLEEIDSNFDKKGTVFGRRWKRRKRTYRHPILNKTGAMKENFISNVDSTKVVIKNKTPYFKFHQLGTSKMATRKMWGITETHSRDIIQKIQEYLVQENSR